MVHLYEIIENKYIIIRGKKRLIKNLKCKYSIVKGVFGDYLKIG